MDKVNEANRLFRSLGNCSESMRDDLDYIIKIFERSFQGDIIKKDEYRNHLMIITNNCNDYIGRKLFIDEKEIRAKKTITGKNGEGIYITDTTILNIEFDDNDKTLTYKDVFDIYDLSNYTSDTTIFMLPSNAKTVYVRIINNNDDFDIIDIKTDKRLNDEPFKFISEDRDSHFDESSRTPYNFTSIAIINDKENADNYNKKHNQPGGGILRKNKGKKGVYKSTKQKVSVIIDKKHYNKTVYKNSKGISYIRRNNEYKLLKKYKLSKL